MDDLHFAVTLPSGLSLELAVSDLTLEKVDAIVNAANRHLAHGGGVASAIVRRGGRVIQEESDAWVLAHGPVSHEAPAVTGAGSLACRYVIHAVGPMWGEGDEDAKLASAVRGSLDAAEDLRLGSIAFPAISTGIYGFPLERAAGVMLAAVLDWSAAHPASALRLARLILFDKTSFEVFRALLREKTA
jgi:O-acetyl-ADP-ribose deacetylase